METLQNNNDFYYCPRCGTADDTKQTIKTIDLTFFQEEQLFLNKYRMMEFNCGICKFKTLVGVTDD